MRDRGGGPPSRWLRRCPADGRSPRQLLADVDGAQDRDHQQQDDHGQEGGTRRRRRILQHADVLIEGTDHRGRAAAGHHLDDEEVAHHDRDHEDRAERDAGLAQRQNDQTDDIKARCAGIPRGLDGALVDPGHGVEDRDNHEDRQLVNIGDHDRETREQQNIERLVDDAGSGERAIDEALLAEQRDPGDHSDDVGGPERHGAQQEQPQRQQLVADVEDQEVGDPEPDQQGEEPGEYRKFQGRPVQLQRELGGEDAFVIVESKARNDTTEAIALNKTCGDDADDRHDKERNKDENQRQDQQPSCMTPLRLDYSSHSFRTQTLDHSVGKTSINGNGPGAFAAGCQATLKSFQRLFMKAASSISVFQHDMFLTRSRKEPPSRTVPAFSIETPYGSLISSGAGLPSYQNAHSVGVISFFAVDGTGL